MSDSENQGEKWQWGAHRGAFLEYDGPKFIRALVPKNMVPEVNALEATITTLRAQLGAAGDLCADAAYFAHLVDERNVSTGAYTAMIEAKNRLLNTCLRFDALRTGKKQGPRVCKFAEPGQTGCNLPNVHCQSPDCLVVALSAPASDTHADWTPYGGDPNCEHDWHPIKSTKDACIKCKAQRKVFAPASDTGSEEGDDGAH